MRKLKVLVVGSQGFIGTRLCQKLDDYIGVDLKDGKDFCDPIVRGILPEVDIVVFLAASLEQTREAYEYNLKLYTALSSFEARIIFTSSAAVYTDCDVLHIEKEFPKPQTIYGKSKVLGENIIKDLFENYTILRLSNVFGDGDGKGVIDTFKNGGNTIYGDGKQIRDYIYVDTVVTAIKRVIDAPERYTGEVYNISSGSGRMTKNVFNLYGHGQAEFVSPRESDVAFSILDNTKAMDEGLL